VEIKRLHQQLQTTIVYVTHDQIEAMTLADRIVLMRDGKIIQVGAPMEVYDNPTNKFTAGFIGAPKMNFIPGTLVNNNDKLAVAIAGQFRLNVPENRQAAYKALINRPVELGIRPENLAVGINGNGAAGAQFDAIVDVVEPMGSEALTFFQLDGIEMAAKSDPHDSPQPGSKVTFYADMSKMHLINPEDETVVPVR